MPTLTIDIPMAHAGQQKVLSEAARFNVLECGRRFGKTTLGINLVVEPAVERGLPTAWFAPTYHAMTEVWRDIVRIVKPITKEMSKQEKRVELITGGLIDFWSLDDADAGRGRKYARVVIDEASVVRELQEAWEQSIRPTLTDLKGDAWFLGTPKGRNYFHRLFVKGEQGGAWRSWRLPTTTNPYISKSEVEEARLELPEAVFNQEYMGIPADDGGNPFGVKAIHDCIMPDLAPGPAVWYGLDLAETHDWTVIIGLNEDGKVCELHRWHGDWEGQHGRIVSVLGESMCCGDATGVGAAVIARLQRNGCPGIEGVVFTSATKQDMMGGLAYVIQNRLTGFPDGTIVRELETYEYEYRPSGVRYTAPQGLHDDCVCALALAVKCMNEKRAVPRIRSLEANRMARIADDESAWGDEMEIGR